jgi:hypothetical protein
MKRLPQKCSLFFTVIVMANNSSAMLLVVLELAETFDAEKHQGRFETKVVQLRPNTFSFKALPSIMTMYFFSSITIKLSLMPCDISH